MSLGKKYFNNVGLRKSQQQFCTQPSQLYNKRSNAKILAKSSTYFVAYYSFVVESEEPSEVVTKLFIFIFCPFALGENSPFNHCSSTLTIMSLHPLRDSTTAMGKQPLFLEYLIKCSLCG